MPARVLGVAGVWGLREGVRRPLMVSNSRLCMNSTVEIVIMHILIMHKSENA